MTCERCGKREATVHLVDMVDGKRIVRWLCPVCAGRSSDDGEADPWFGFGGLPNDDQDEEDSYSLASFLGEMFSPGEEKVPVDPPACPSCGYTLAEFRGTNRLGCPLCYTAFRKPLLSILGHLHRHVSHLGKVPRSGQEGESRAAVLGRARIALEKAIAAEDFEKAARLRDEILRLETEPGNGPDPEGGAVR